DRRSAVARRDARSRDGQDHVCRRAGVPAQRGSDLGAGASPEARARGARRDRRRGVEAAMRMHPAIESVVRVVSRLHVTGFRLFSGVGPLGRRTLILTTRGRRSGREIATPLFYVEDGGRLYVVASFGGNDVAPGWYKNLLVDPAVTVEVG